MAGYLICEGNFIFLRPPIFMSAADADNTSYPRVFSLQSKIIFLSLLKSALQNFLWDLTFIKGVRKDPLESELVFLPKSNSGF